MGRADKPSFCRTLATRERVGWIAYDWANSAFSTTVVVVFLGPYLTSITQAAADAILIGEEKRQESIVSADDEFVEVKEEPSRIKVTARKKAVAAREESPAGTEATAEAAEKPASKPKRTVRAKGRGKKEAGPGPGGEEQTEAHEGGVAPLIL